MNLQEYASTYPEYAFDFSQPIAKQSRVFEGPQLADLPNELIPQHEYRNGGRGRPNLNQTRTHSQCYACRRVLRNDMFNVPPSFRRANLVFSYCISCLQSRDSKRYGENAASIKDRRVAIWNYIAPFCIKCGFSGHPAAMDMHHLGEEPKEAAVSSSIAKLAASGTDRAARSLLSEASKCIPLCANCHRMLHAGVFDAPIARPRYTLSDLLSTIE